MMALVFLPHSALTDVTLSLSNELHWIWIQLHGSVSVDFGSEVVIQELRQTWEVLQCHSEVARFSLGNVNEKNAFKHLLENVLFSTLWKCLWVNWELWTYWVLRMLGLVAGRDNKKLRGNNILCVLLSILFPGWPNNHTDGCLCVWTNVESLWTVKLY